MFQVNQEFVVLGKYHGRVVGIEDNVVCVVYSGSSEHHRWEDPPAPYRYKQDELEQLVALKEGMWLVVPEQFRGSNKGDWCVECYMPTNGMCGHFLDARDYRGPFVRIGWMDASFDREAYDQWINEHFHEIRYIQEHPNLVSTYPDGSLGSIPYLAKLVEKRSKS